MTKYILIGGHIYKAKDGGEAFCQELVKAINNRPVKILDCLFARPEDSWKDRFEDDRKFFSKKLDDFKIELASPDKFIEQIKNSDVVFFQGGNPQQLIKILESVGDWDKELNGKTVVGSSGGADIISKYYGIGKTLNIGTGLGLLPIKFIPHWKSDYGVGLIVNWELLLEKVRSYKENLETIVLKEGEFVTIDE
jgi:peptidase E